LRAQDIEPRDGFVVPPRSPKGPRGP
jgi:hypothetical protein